jgi:hypothetical protein
MLLITVLFSVVTLMCAAYAVHDRFRWIEWNARTGSGRASPRAEPSEGVAVVNPFVSPDAFELDSGWPEPSGWPFDPKASAV